MASQHLPYITLFPTTRAIPEELQIGRTEFIDDLQATVLGGTSVLLLEERRVGKSSAATAVLKRIQVSDPPVGIALHIDLRDGAGSSKALISRLLSRAKDEKALTLGKAVVERGRAGAADVKRRGLSALRSTKGQLGDDVDDIAVVGDALATLFGDPKEASVQNVLEAIDAKARANDQQVVIFIDEVQDLADWSDGEEVQNAIQTVSSRLGSRLTFIFAGSEKTTVAALFRPEGPLGWVGLRQELPEITLDQWKAGLRPRFTKAGLEIDDTQITQAFVVADGHPLRMMSICAQSLRLVQGDEITQGVMAQAIVAAKDHPSWQER